MALVAFRDSGYDYFDEGNYILFTTDNTHNYLFDYVAKDLSQLSKLLERYVSKRMDIATFDLNNDYQDNDNDSTEIKEMLMSLHPYYAHEYREAIIKAIGYYFNDLLVYSSYTGNSFKCIYREKWYIERFTELAAAFLREDEKYSEKFYGKYKERVNADECESIEENFVDNIPTEQPIGFINEITTQKAVKNMLYLILDISAPIISELAMPQRIWLYSNIYQSDMEVIKKLSFRPPILYQSNHDYSLRTEYINKMYDLFKPLYGLSIVDIDCDGVPPGKLNFLNDAVKYAKTITKTEVYEECEINNLHQLLYLEILSMIQANTDIRKCKHCGKYFIVTNRKIAYCDRTDERGDRCSAVGSKCSFQKKLKTEYPLKIYNRAYKTHHARVQHGTMSRNDFLAWCDEAKENLNKVRAGELDIFIFEVWLNN